MLTWIPAVKHRDDDDDNNNKDVTISFFLLYS